MSSVILHNGTVPVSNGRALSNDAFVADVNDITGETDKTPSEVASSLSDINDALGAAITAKGGTVASDSTLGDKAEEVGSIPSGGAILLFSGSIAIEETITSLTPIDIGTISTGLSRPDLATDAHILALEATYMGDVSSLPMDYSIKTINMIGCNSDSVELIDLKFLFYLRNRDTPTSIASNRRAVSFSRGFVMSMPSTDLSTLVLKVSATGSTANAIQAGEWQIKLYDLGISQVT